MSESCFPATTLDEQKYCKLSDVDNTSIEMAYDMDDGVGPEVVDKGGLGYTPQRRNLTSNLLPYANELDLEIGAQLIDIKTNLVKAIALSDIRCGALYWISKLHSFVKVNSFCFSKSDHVAFVELLYEVLITPRVDIRVTLDTAKILLVLLRKASLLTPDDLQLQWRPLYNLHQKLFHNAQAYNGMNKLPPLCETTINSVIRHCRTYFAAGTTEELLEEFLPRACSFDEQMRRSIKYLDMFVPILPRQGGRPPNHHLWRPLMLDMVENSPYWETTAMHLLSRLAWKNIGTIDWEDQLPLFFTKVLRSFRLPVGYKGTTAYSTRSYDDSNLAMFIVANLGGGSIAQQQLSRLVGVVESYLHPSNVGNWTTPLMGLLSKITLYFNMRFNRERRQNDDNTWEHSIPPAKRLTEADIDEFVESLLTVTLTALFGKTGSLEAAAVLGRLATLRTSLVVPKFLDLLYPALTSSTEPIRLQACLRALTLVSRPLVTGGTDFPAGPSHVLPIMKLLLPGIDPNDICKTTSTFQTLITFSTLIPMADCSAAPGQVEMSELEAELCYQTAEFEDFLVMFLDRCLSVVENSASSHLQQPVSSTFSSNTPPAMSKEESLLESFMSATIRVMFEQVHPDIAKVLVRHLTNYVTSHTLETSVSGKLLGAVCRQATKAHPQRMLSALVPKLSRLLLSLTASEAVQSNERPDDEIMYNLLILTEVAKCGSGAMLQFVPSITAVLQRCLSLRCLATQQQAAVLLGNTLAALTHSEVCEHRSTVLSWQAPYAEFLPIRHWGGLVSGGWSSMKVEWFEAGPEQQRAVTELLHTFLLPELDRLDAAAKDLSSLTKDQLVLSANILLSSLCAGPLLPLWEEEPIQLFPMAVDSARPQAVLSSTPQFVHLTAEGRPSNVRKAILETALRLCDAMLTADSDNTTAYSHVVDILFNSGLLHTIARGDYEGRSRILTEKQRMLRNNLVGPQQYWHRIRNMMTRRASMLHKSRTLEYMDGAPFTASYSRVLQAALSLATSNYSQVRSGGQWLLHSLINQFPGCYSLMLPTLASNLALDPVHHHKAVKGTLCFLTGLKCKGSLGEQDWQEKLQIWPALLAAQQSEKPSIALLLSSLFQRVRTAEMSVITQQTPPRLGECSDRVMQQFGVAVAAEDLQCSATRLQQEAATNLQYYHTLVHDLVTLLDSGKLQWRHEQLGLCMLGSLIRTDEPFPAGAVRKIVTSLVNDNMHIRQLGIYYLSAVLRSQKRAHSKVPLDPYSITGDPCAAPASLQDYMRPGVDRPDNRWLQYDPSCVNMTEERYNQRRFIHPTYLGFTSWPKRVYIYAPHSDQPQLDRAPAELSPGEREIYDFFSSPDKVEKMIDYFSLEDNSRFVGKFDANKMKIFKGVFRNFGPTFLPIIRPHLERLAEDCVEASQRTAAEILAGLVRATKHWPHRAWQEAMSLSTSVLTTALGKMSAESLECWNRAIMRVSMDRDANCLAPILEMLIDFPDFVATSSFHLHCQLQLCSTFLHQQEWRVMEVLQRVLVAITPALSHPYKAVRDNISSLLFTVFNQSSELFFGGVSNTIRITGSMPDLEKFIEYVLGELGSLQEYSGGNNSDNSKTPSSSDILAATDASHRIQPHAMHVLMPAVEAMVTVDEDSLNTFSSANDESLQSATADENSVPFHGEDEASNGPPSSFSEGDTVTSKGDMLPDVMADTVRLPSPSYDCAVGETDERKNAFRIINTMCSFIHLMSSRNHSSTPPHLYRLLGALCQLESVDSEQEVCRNCVVALCVMGQGIIRRQDIADRLLRIQDIAQYRWWRARSAAIGVLQMMVFHNALTMMASAGAQALVLRMVLDRLSDERIEVRNMASKVLASLLHIDFVVDPQAIRDKFIKTVRQKMRRSATDSDAWPSERIVAVHGAVLGLTAFVESVPYTLPPYLPVVLCTLAHYINLPHPIAGSIRDTLSNFRRTHHDNWQEHKQHFSPEQLDTLSELLLSPSYYA